MLSNIKLLFPLDLVCFHSTIILILPTVYQGTELSLLCDHRGISDHRDFIYGHVPPERSLSPTLQSGRNTWVFFLYPEARRAVLTCWELLSKLHSDSQPHWGVLRSSSWEANESSKEPLENSPQNSHLLGGTRQRVPLTWSSEVTRVAAGEGCPALLSRAQSKGKTARHSFIVSSTETPEPGIANFNRLLKRCCCCCCRAAGMREKCTKITTRRRTEDWKPTGEKPSLYNQRGRGRHQA